MGRNDIDITAVDALGNVSVETVIVEYEAGNAWPLSYDIAWDNVAEVTDAYSKLSMESGISLTGN